MVCNVGSGLRSLLRIIINVFGSCVEKIKVRFGGFLFVPFIIGVTGGCCDGKPSL